MTNKHLLMEIEAVKEGGEVEALEFVKIVLFETKE